MFVVYVLINSISGRRYIGSTNNLERRISEHNRGQTKSTRQKGNWKLVYQEIFNTSIEAKKREFVLKSYKGGSALKKLFKSGSMVDLPAMAG